MAVTLSARAGSSLRVAIDYRRPGTPPLEQPLVPTTGSHARLQVRSAAGNRRVLISTTESSNSSAVLFADPDAVTGGRWFLHLSAAITRSLPPTSHFEVELVSNTDPDAVLTVCSGSIRVTPESVKA